MRALLERIRRTGRHSRTVGRRGRPGGGRHRLTLATLTAVLSLLVVSVAVGAVRAEPERLPVAGVPNGPVGAKALPGLDIQVDARGNDPHAVRLTLDGEPVSGRVDGSVVHFQPGYLPDGKHTLAATIPPRGSLSFLRTGPGVTTTFTVQSKPPRLDQLQPVTALSYRHPVTVRGKAIGAERVSVGDQVARVSEDGSFELTLPRAPVGARLVAVDAAGNEAAQDITATVTVPPIKAVHVTAYGWADDGLREGVLRLARAGRINAVQLDIKDEDGVVGYDSQVPLARESGAVASIYDARAAVKQLHDLGLQVVGRIVAFRDPTVAGWAWRSGHPDWVIQNPAGQPYASHYGPIAFTNFARPEIRRYNTDLAVEAARIGFDGIMYDYIRRPDGNLSQMRFPGATQEPSISIADFLRDSRDPIRDAGAYLSAAVFGIAATRPDEIAQDIPAMAKSLDYVSPMLYPSHWNAGEYGVANPNAQPYDIVYRALADFTGKLAGTGAKLVPWLQDFSLGVDYGPAQVQAQIAACAAANVDSYFLWSPTVTYHLD